MAGRRCALLVLGCLLACSASAHAGLYSGVESFDSALSEDYRQFREALIYLWDVSKLIGDPEYRSKTPLTRRYSQVLQTLKQGIPRDLSIGERVDVGAALIRTGKYDEAIHVLEPAGAKDQRSFLLLSNLATAYYLAGQDRLAVRAVSKALDAWPKEWTKASRDEQVVLTLRFGWDANRFAWYRRAETYYKRLLLHRLGQPLDKPDDLFGVRFVGEGGKYEAGKISAAERKKLPGDAVRIVEQLLIWLPNDVRLQWLLGELYNAGGDTGTALEIFNNLVGFNGKVTVRSQFMDLREHRTILQAQAAKSAAAGGGKSLPGAGQPSSPPPSTGDQKVENGSSGWSPSPWQTLGVGFLAGLLVALLGTWQVREIVRRRQLAPRQ